MAGGLETAVDSICGVGDMGAVASGVFVAGTVVGSAGLTLQLVPIDNNVSNRTGSAVLITIYFLRIREPVWHAFVRARLYHIAPVRHNNNYDPPLTPL